MMLPLLEPQVQFGAVQPGDDLRKAMPGNISEDRVMGSAGIGNLHRAASDVDGSLAPDKVAVDILSVALLETPEFLGQHAVEGISNHSHKNIEVHLDKNGRRQGVEVEELDRLGDDILHSPSSGVITDDALRRCGKIVGDQKGRGFMTVSPKDDLPKLSFIILEGNERLMDVRIGIFTFVMRNVDILPGGEFLQIFDQFLPPPPEGNKPDSLTVQQGKMFVGGELGIKDKGGGNALVYLLPEGQDIEDLFIGLFPHKVGGSIEDQFGGRILGKKGQRPLHPFSPGPGPMFLKDRFVVSAQ